MNRREMITYAEMDSYSSEELCALEDGLNAMLERETDPLWHEAIEAELELCRDILQARYEMEHGGG